MAMRFLRGVSLQISNRVRLICSGLLIYLIVYTIYVITTRDDKDKLEDIESKNVDAETKVSSNYERLLKKYYTDFEHLPLSKRCSLYFEELNNFSENWVISSQDQRGYNKMIYFKDTFIKERVNRYKEQHNNQIPTDSDMDNFEAEYLKAIENTENAEQVMIDSITHMRIFGKCYLNQQNSLFSLKNNVNEISKSNCESLESKLFPWMSGLLPVYSRWDGTVVYIGVPKISDYLNGNYPKEKQTKLEKLNCFVETFRTNFNGKGIVLSIADKYERETIGLIRVLRALGNELPIQLIHNGDISEEAQERIIKASRDEDFKVPIELYQKIKSSKVLPTNFPKQEVWFVNINRSIRDDYHVLFKSFGHKLLATYFNSFEEMILMDADVVPFQIPSKLFNTKSYKKTNTIFFKDRYTDERMLSHNSEYFMRLMPSKIDTMLFQIPAAGELTTQNRYLKDGVKQVMESGMLAMKRSERLIGILIAIQLNFWSAVNTRVWGDKELFWLSQSMSGNENYSFDKYDTVAIGELTPKSKRQGLVSNELCSTHPGHLNSDDDTLFWINSGMRTCKSKNPNIPKEDFTKDRFKDVFKSVQDLQNYYDSPIRITSAIIPPVSHVKIAGAAAGEPEYGWISQKECFGYLWCAYDVIGPNTLLESKGRVIDFEEDVVAKHDYIGKLWIGDDLVSIGK